jgi:hypothetical protein
MRVQQAQCSKCGTWRTQGLELSHHEDICTGFRCPWCGHPSHDGHKCHAIKAVVYRTPQGYDATTPCPDA